MSEATLAAVGTVAEVRAPVVASVPVGEEYHQLVVKAGVAAAVARPGQFFMLECPASGSAAPFLRRPMSLYAADAALGQVEFLFKLVGTGTRALARLRPGDALDLLGPLGHSFSLSPSWRHIIIAGRGAGLATLAPLTEEARAQGIGVVAVLSARTPAAVVAAERFRAAQAEVRIVTDNEGTSGPAAVERMLRETIAAGRGDALFTCGSARLLAVMQRLARTFRLPGQVALEAQMACGLGMCHCCVRDFLVDGEIVPRRVCVDGPVFSLAEALA